MALGTIRRTLLQQRLRIRAVAAPSLGGSASRCRRCCSLGGRNNHVVGVGPTTQSSSSEPETAQRHRRPLAVVLGVANHRSIAWACVQEFLQQGYDCVFTYQQAQHASKMEQLVLAQSQQQQAAATANATIPNPPRILGFLPCNVEHPNELAITIGERLPELLRQGQQPTNDSDSTAAPPPDRPVDAVVHSIAYCRDLDQPLLQTSLENYLQAQHISAYSFLETARCFQQHQLLLPPPTSTDATTSSSSSSSSFTALTYLGSTRAVPGYGAMGPAKAALESLVRGLAVELGPNLHCRCNAVAAGPVRTTSLRGIPHAHELLQHVQTTAPLRRNIRVEEVARTVVWVASPAASGITGQTIYVDAGYSAVVPVVV